MGVELYVRNSGGEFVVADGERVLQAAKRYLKNRIRRGRALTSPQIVRDFLAVTLGARDCEYFCLVLLDSRNHFLRFVELFRGHLTGAAVHPREVVKVVLEAGAANVLLVHNHPSGCTEPSSADELITRKLKEALATIEVHLADHLIVATSEVISFAERGLL